MSLLPGEQLSPVPPQALSALGRAHWIPAWRALSHKPAQLITRPALEQLRGAEFPVPAVLPRPAPRGGELSLCEILALLTRGLSCSCPCQLLLHPPDVQVAAESSPPWAQVLSFQKKVSAAQLEPGQCRTVCSGEETAAAWGRRGEQGTPEFWQGLGWGSASSSTLLLICLARQLSQMKWDVVKPKLSSGSFIWLKMLCYQILLLINSNF